MGSQLHSHFPQLLLRLPTQIGFNVEVKYPVPELTNGRNSFPYFDLNVMADRILKVVYEHAKQRNIIFSSFNADMCTM
jgi:glycerophosphodiester phosphodiesterase